MSDKPRILQLTPEEFHQEILDELDPGTLPVVKLPPAPDFTEGGVPAELYRRAGASNRDAAMLNRVVAHSQPGSAVIEVGGQTFPVTNEPISIPRRMSVGRPSQFSPAVPTPSTPTLNDIGEQRVYAQDTGPGQLTPYKPVARRRELDTPAGVQQDAKQDDGLKSRLDLSGAPTKRPPDRSFWTEAVNMLGQVLAAQKQSNPVVPSFRWNGPPQATPTDNPNAPQLAAGISGLLGNLIERPQRQYDQQMQDAMNRARILGTNRSSSSAAQRTEMEMLRERRLQDAAERYDQQNRSSEEKYRNEHDPKHATAVEYGRRLYRNGVAPSLDAVEGLSHKELVDNARIWEQEKLQRAREEQAAATAANEERRSLMQASISEEDKARLIAEQETRRRQSGMIEGVQWAGDNPPQSHEDVDKVRELFRERQILMRDLGALSQLQQNLEEQGRFGGWGTPEKYLGTPEGKRLIAEASARWENVSDSLRRLKQYGTPQKTEFERLEKLVAQPGSVRAYLTGPQAWSGLAKTIDDRVRESLKGYRAYYYGERPEAEGKPDMAGYYKPRQRTIPAARRVSGGKQVEENRPSGDVDTENAVPTQPPESPSQNTVVPVPGSARTWKWRKPDGSVTDFTAEQVRQLLERKKQGANVGEPVQ